MPKYRVRWTETMYNEIEIEADSADEADMIFSAQSYPGEPECTDMQFGEGPTIEEISSVIVE